MLGIDRGRDARRNIHDNYILVRRNTGFDPQEKINRTAATITKPWMVSIVSYLRGKRKYPARFNLSRMHAAQAYFAEITIYYVSSKRNIVRFVTFSTLLEHSCRLNGVTTNVFFHCYVGGVSWARSYNIPLMPIDKEGI